MKWQELNDELIGWHVDEVIECLDVKPTTERALMLAAPTAYMDDQVELETVWEQLESEVQQDIILAQRKQIADLMGK
jgi:hypothetical protein